jgi:hypothetical protein
LRVSSAVNYSTKSVWDCVKLSHNIVVLTKHSKCKLNFHNLICLTQTQCEYHKAFDYSLQLFSKLFIAYWMCLASILLIIIFVSRRNFENSFHFMLWLFSFSYMIKQPSTKLYFHNLINSHSFSIINFISNWKFFLCVLLLKVRAKHTNSY